MNANEDKPLVTRVEAEKLNKDAIRRNKDSYVKFFGITLNETQTKIVRNLYVAVVLTLYFIGAILVFSAIEEKTIFTGAVIGVVGILLSVVGVAATNPILPDLIRHDIFPGDVFRFQGNKFHETHYIRILDCDYSEKAHAAQPGLTNPITNEFVPNDPDSIWVMSSEEILKGTLYVDKK